MSSPDMLSKKLALPSEAIDDMIREIRGLRVMLDVDLARVYGVPTNTMPNSRSQARHVVDRISPFFTDQIKLENSALAG
jgi:hypothetical protein